MSYATIAGICVGFGLFIVAILMSTDQYMIFIDFPSFLMVVGGTIASTFIAYEARYVIESLKTAVTIISSHKESQSILTDEVGRIIRWGYIVQKNGLQGLESDAETIKGEDKFMGFAIDLVITGYTGDEIREILANTVETKFQRSSTRFNILKDMGGSSPAFGMMGTLVGLIIMLQNMDDPDAIGPGMAVALITTLYGVMAARLAFLPSSSKVKQREEIVQFKNYLVAEGMALLAERKSPRYIQDKMNSFLDPAEHFDIDRDMKEKP